MLNRFSAMIIIHITFLLVMMLSINEVHSNCSVECETRTRCFGISCLVKKRLCAGCMQKEKTSRHLVIAGGKEKHLSGDRTVEIMIDTNEHNELGNNKYKGFHIDENSAADHHIQHDSAEYENVGSSANRGSYYENSKLGYYADKTAHEYAQNHKPLFQIPQRNSVGGMMSGQRYSENSGWYSNKMGGNRHYLGAYGEHHSNGYNLKNPRYVDSQYHHLDNLNSAGSFYGQRGHRVQLEASELHGKVDDSDEDSESQESYELNKKRRHSRGQFSMINMHKQGNRAHLSHELKEAEISKEEPEVHHDERLDEADVSKHDNEKHEMELKEAELEHQNNEMHDQRIEAAEISRADHEKHEVQLQQAAISKQENVKHEVELQQADLSKQDNEKQEVELKEAEVSKQENEKQEVELHEAEVSKQENEKQEVQLQEAEVSKQENEKQEVQLQEAEVSKQENEKQEVQVQEAEVSKQENEKQEIEVKEAEVSKQDNVKHEVELQEADLSKQDNEKQEVELKEAEVSKQENKKHEVELQEVDFSKQDDEKQEVQLQEAEVSKQENEKHEVELQEADISKQDNEKHEEQLETAEITKQDNVKHEVKLEEAEISKENNEKHEAELEEREISKQEQEKHEVQLEQAELSKENNEKHEVELHEAELSKEDNQKQEMQLQEAEVSKQENEKHEVELQEAEVSKQENEKHEVQLQEAEVSKQENEKQEVELEEADISKQDSEKHEEQLEEADISKQDNKRHEEELEEAELIKQANEKHELQLQDAEISRQNREKHEKELQEISLSKEDHGEHQREELEELQHERSELLEKNKQNFKLEAENRELSHRDSQHHLEESNDAALYKQHNINTLGADLYDADHEYGDGSLQHEKKWANRYSNRRQSWSLAGKKHSNHFLHSKHDKESYSNMGHLEKSDRYGLNEFNYLKESSDLCLKNPCGLNSQCHANAGRAVCTCALGFYGNPFTECKAGECQRHTDCPSYLTCSKNRCINVCATSCGINAICLMVDHEATCSCPPGFTGNAKFNCRLIEAVDQCIPNPCGANTQCRIVASRPHCQCLLNYIGDPQIGCRRECEHDFECSKDRSCIDNRCQDSCKLCGRYAICESVAVHKPVCKCPPDYFGNPYAVCKPECVTHADCPASKAVCYQFKCRNPCEGACGTLAQCEVHGITAVCSCPKHLTGNPLILCRPYEWKDFCEPNPCGRNARCELSIDDKGAYIPVCKCLPGFYNLGTGDCVPGDCADDRHCPSHKSCENFLCEDACKNQCGKGSKCEAMNHTAICSCPPGYKGNPTIECFKDTKKPCTMLRFCPFIVPNPDSS